MEIKMGENRGRRLFRKRRDSSTVLSILHLSAREVASNHPFLFHPLSRYFFFNTPYFLLDDICIFLFP